MTPAQRAGAYRLPPRPVHTGWPGATRAQRIEQAIDQLDPVLVADDVDPGERDEP